MSHLRVLLSRLSRCFRRKVPKFVGTEIALSNNNARGATMQSMNISLEGKSQKGHALSHSLSEKDALKVIWTDALVVTPSSIVVLGICYSLLRDSNQGADFGQTLIALFGVIFSVGFGFSLLRALYRFKVERDDNSN